MIWYSWTPQHRTKNNNKSKTYAEDLATVKLIGDVRQSEEMNASILIPTHNHIIAW
jgi:hypothetical protein